MPLIALPANKPLLKFSQLEHGSLLMFDYNYQLGYMVVHKKIGETSVQKISPLENTPYEVNPANLCLEITVDEMDELQDTLHSGTLSNSDR